MSFSTDMDAALDGMDTDHKATVKSAFTTFQTAVSGEQTTYGTEDPEKIAFNERLIELGRDLAAQMR